MNIVSRGAFQVTSTLWQPRPGAFTLTLVCRAAFEIAPGESPMMAPPRQAAERALEEAIVAAPLKRWPEVIVVGHVHAPEGKPVQTLTARVAVGELDKAIQVQGDRFFTAEGHLLGPAPFTRMPLRWERAAGGPGTWNPGGVAVGADARAAERGILALPNFEPVGATVTTRNDVVPPVGLGPLAPGSPMRMQRLGRHAATWDPAAWSARPLAEDFDFAYFNAAPHDQVLPSLAGGEPIVLEHLHPVHAHVATRLRVVPPSASAGFGGAAHEIRLACDTLVIDADRGIAELVWRGQLALDRPDPEGMIMVIEDRAAGASSRPHTATAVLADPAAAAAARRAAIALTTAPALALTPALPFGAEPPAPPGKSPVVQTIAPSAPRRPAVPFRAPAEDAGPASAPPASAPPASAPAAQPPPRSASVVMTMAPSPARAERPLPFARAQEAPIPAPRFGPPPEMAQPIVAQHEPALPRFELPMDTPIAPAPVASLPIAPLPIALPVASPSIASAPIAPPPAEPAPPEMIGPIPIEAAVPAPEAEAAAPEAAAPEAAEDDALPIEAYPIERCARIAARRARKPEEARAILDAEDLREPKWEALHAHWLGRIDAEARRGKNKLLSAYDAAYVGEIEAARGPIDAPAYARLVIAAERGVLDETLGEMGVPGEAMMRIRRVWLSRITTDAAAAAKVRAEVRAAAEA